MTFNDKAKDWDKKQQFHERARVIAEEIKRVIPLNKEMRVLDFGCGTGLLSNNFRNDFNSITLTDTSTGMLDVLREKINSEKLTNFNPYLLDLVNEDFSPSVEKFDLIYTSMTLHHVVETDRIISKFSSLINTGGYVCIADLDKEDGSFHQGDVDPNIHQGFDRSNLKSLMSKVGFETVFYKLILDIEKVVENGDVRKYPVFLIIAKKNSLNN